MIAISSGLPNRCSTQTTNHGDDTVRNRPLPARRPSVSQKESLECQSKGVTLIVNLVPSWEPFVNKKRY